MTKASQWDKLRNVLNGHRNGKMLTDEAIIEISFILGVEVETNNPFELIETPNSGIAPTGGSSDRLDRTDKLKMARIVPEAVKSAIADEEARTVDADKMAHLWSLYVKWKKFWFDIDTVTMEEFAQYMIRYHHYDIRNGS